MFQTTNQENISKHVLCKIARWSCTRKQKERFYKMNMQQVHVCFAESYDIIIAGMKTRFWRMVAHS